MYLLDIKPEETGKLVPQIMEFFKQRLRNLLMDQGIRYDVIDAVFADKRNDDMVDLAVRCKALAAYVEAGNAEPLVQVSVRVSNLCKKIEKEVAISGALFKDESENKLHEVVAAVSKEIIPEIVLYDYAAVLKAGEKVIEPVNAFFDNVMVMDEDENVKNNRLAMLEEVRGIVNAVGDLSLLVL